MDNINAVPIFLEYGIEDPYDIFVAPNDGTTAFAPLIASGVIDLVYEASHSASTKFTDVPLETGAVVSDGATDTPLRLTLKIIVSDFDQTAFMANRNGSSVMYGEFIDNPQIRAKFLSSGWGTVKGNRARLSLSKLQTLRRSKNILKVDTILAQYDNMVIERIKTTESFKSGKAMLATVTLKQLKFVTATLEQKLASTEFLNKMTPAELSALDKSINMMKEKAQEEEEARSRAEAQMRAEAVKSGKLQGYGDPVLGTYTKYGWWR